MDFQKYAPVTVAVAVTAALMSFLYGPNAQAKQEKAVPLPSFGSVNLEKVVAESKGNKADADSFRLYVESLSKVLQELEQGGARYLSEAEIREIAVLNEKSKTQQTLTEAEKKRLSDLDDKGAVKKERKRKLENTTTSSSSEAERKEFADLTSAEEKGVQTLLALKAEYQRKLEDRQEELSKKLENDIRAAVAKVAKDRGITVVFNNTSVVYASSDVTEEVIKAINK